MKPLLKALALGVLFLAPAPLAHAQVSFGIRIGEPPAERAYRVPRQPGPDYVWIEGYQYPNGRSYRWHDGYWTRPPYEGAYWVAPYYSQGMYFVGEWRGDRGNRGHDHRWDRDRRRDDRDDHGPDRGGNRGRR